MSTISRVRISFDKIGIRTGSDNYFWTCSLACVRSIQSSCKLLYRDVRQTRCQSLLGYWDVGAYSEEKYCLPHIEVIGRTDFISRIMFVLSREEGVSCSRGDDIHFRYPLSTRSPLHAHITLCCPFRG